MIELRHYRYIAAIAEHGGFSAAASALGISTPTLSVQVRYVEDLLGTRLFARTSQKVEITHAGQIFVEEAAKVLRAASIAEHAGHQAARGERGHILVGYVGSASYGGVLQRLTWTFRQHFPEAEVDVGEYPISGLPQMVEDRRLDFALIRSPFTASASLTSLVMSDDHYVAAISLDHPLAGATHPLTAREFAGSAFVVADQHLVATEEIGARGGFAPIIQSMQRTLVAVLTQVSLGGRVAIIPASVIDTIMLPGVVMKPLSAPEIRTSIVGLVRSDNPSPLIKRFMETARTLPSLRS